MTDRELMQMALDAMRAVSVDEHLCNAAHHVKKDRHGIDEPCPIAKRFNDIAEALRARLAQPEQEPNIEEMAEAVHNAYLTTCDALKWGVKPENRVPYAELTEDSKELDRASVRAVLRFTAPPQREWQGLTDEQVKQIEMSASSTLSAIYLAEAQLKGKNT